VDDGLLKELKNVLYVDKVYNGIAELRRRMMELPSPSMDLPLAEYRLFSQNGEDGITVELLRQLPDIEPFFVEFGVGDGWSCNTRILAEVFGWRGLYLEIDTDAHRALEERYRNTSRIATLCAAVTPDNINELFNRAEVPERLGVLSIDIDGQDYWVWQALSDRYRPQIVIVEVNTSFPPNRSVSESYDAPQGPLTETFGASISAMEKLGAAKGYTLAHVDMAGVNAFFVPDEFAGRTQIKGILDRSPNFGLRGRFHSRDVLYEGGDAIPRPFHDV